MVPDGVLNSRDLFGLAALYGVQTAYFDVTGRRHRATPEALLAVLRALGAPLEGPREVSACFQERHAHLWRRVCAPVTVAWDGRLASIDLSLPARTRGSFRCHLHLEDGTAREWTTGTDEVLVREGAAVGGERFVRGRLRVAQKLPFGYHRLSLHGRGQTGESLVIAAPRLAYVPGAEQGARTWGVFLPLYALRAAGLGGVGDFSDLGRLMDWINGLGGGVVATLPLLAAFLDEPFEPSPYVPVSRLFWNEFYVDVTASPEWPRCAEARELMALTDRVRDEEDSRPVRHVDYRQVTRVKRRILEALSACFFAEHTARQEDFSRFRRDHPTLDDYARFRAVGERRRTTWPAWPSRARDGAIRPGDYDEAAWRYHLYAQWLADAQLRTLSTKARRHGPGLYLDLPLGVHPDGYDVWREREDFVRTVSGGAPPDAFFTRGQDWGFPPLHPERIRDRHFRYFRAVVGHHLEHAGILRIDHVMGLHRLFWVPHGMEAQDGVYVTYPAEELYAVLTLESHRHRAIVAGEDLGTVPPVVHRAMARHRVQQSYVVQYEAHADSRTALRPVPLNTMAGLNTHDMPSFAAFWHGRDIQDRRALGLLDAQGVRVERARRRSLERALVAFLRARHRIGARRTGAAGVLRALLAHLAATPARIVVVTLEDLWLEREPQNVPGTGPERPNWRRQARYGFEVFSRMRSVRATLRLVDRLRGQKGRARVKR